MFKLKKFDYLIIFISVVLIVTSFILISDNKGLDSLRIDVDGKTYYFNLSEDRIISSDLLGVNITIQIEDNSAKIVDSDCPDKLCVGMAPLVKSGQWAACLPNRVFIVIESKEETEIDESSW